MNTKTKVAQLDAGECLDILLTDIQLHVQKVRNPNSLGRQYIKALHGSKQRRAYSNSVKFDGKKRTITLALDLGEEHLFAEAQKRGKKYIRYFIKQDGIPLYLGSDTIERLKALAKKFQK